MTSTGNNRGQDAEQPSAPAPDEASGRETVQQPEPFTDRPAEGSPEEAAERSVRPSPEQQETATPAEEPATEQRTAASSPATAGAPADGDTEAKRELIRRMSALRDGDLHLATRARRIRELQEAWTALEPPAGSATASAGEPAETITSQQAAEGEAEQAAPLDSLTAEFNEIARQAFEPCKIYFRDRKALMRQNMAERRLICEQLEAYAASLSAPDAGEPDISAINRLEKEARDQWKQHAPVPQKKLAELQSRFNAVLRDLRNARRRTLDSHAARKQQLVDEAAALVAAEDLPVALKQARELQKTWKTIGPAPHKEERRLWEAFRKHCDALFARRPAPDATKRDARPPRGGKNRTAARPERAGAPPRPSMDAKQQKLIDSLMPAAELCRLAEEQLLDGRPADLETLHRQWQDLELPAGSPLSDTLQQRMERLQTLQGNSDTLQQLARDNAEQARLLCVEMEIQSGADSPEEDRALRMQRQLEHLKQGLGQALADAATRSRRLGELRAELLSLGPLPAGARETLEKRLQRIR